MPVEEDLNHTIVMGTLSEVEKALDGVSLADLTLTTNREPPLHLCARHRFAAAGRLVLDAGINIDMTDRFDRTAIYVAITNNTFDLAVILADAGAHIDPEYEAEHANELRLWTAVLRGDLDELRRRIDAGDNVDQTPKDGKARGWTALWLAVALDREDAARMLIQAKAALDTPCYFSLTPLLLACRKNSISLVKQLLVAGADLTKCTDNDNTVVHEAITASSLELLNVLREAGADVNKPGYNAKTPLYCAVDQNDVQMVAWLLASGASVDVVARYGSVWDAVSWNNGQLILNMLLEAGMNINVKGVQGKTFISKVLAFIAPERAGFVASTARLLLSAGATVDGATAAISPLVPSDVIRAIVPEDTPFWLAANNDAPMLAAELAGGLDPNTKTENGMTLLHWACAGDAPECVQVLLEAGADPEYRVEQCESRYEDESDYGYQDYDDDEPCVRPQPIFYCMHESSECLMPLLNFGVNVNTTHELRIPVHFALVRNSPACVAALIAAGSLTSRENCEGRRIAHLLELPLQMPETPVEAIKTAVELAPTNIIEEKIYQQSLLNFALSTAPVEGVRCLLDCGADPCQPMNIRSKDYPDMLAAAESYIQNRVFNKKNIERVQKIYDYLKTLEVFQDKTED